MVVYHGGQDNQITSFNTERFYGHLSCGMDASSEELDDFFRFFRIPGMFHCNSGPGAWVIGQGGGASAKGVPFESTNNVLAALVRWVENGTAVEDIVGTKFVSDTTDLGVAFHHRHCKFVFPIFVKGRDSSYTRYPSRSTYVGGDAASLSSWECR